jgi:hypothetical protein
MHFSALPVHKYGILLLWDRIILSKMQIAGKSGAAEQPPCFAPPKLGRRDYLDPSSHRPPHLRVALGLGKATWIYPFPRMQGPLVGNPGQPTMPEGDLASSMLPTTDSLKIDAS